MVFYTTHFDGWRMWRPVIINEEASCIFEETPSLELMTQEDPRLSDKSTSLILI